jgi:shikimate dehydrogenase
MSYGLIGEKLSHSYSKKIHESFGKYKYDLIELDKDNFASFMEARQFSGINVTIPYKIAVMPFCDALTPVAEEIGSVNTIYFQDERLVGDNTDYFGFIYMLTRSGISMKNKKVLIIGAGGSSLMINKAAKDSGAKEIIVASRSGLNANILLEKLNEHLDAQIIINATPVGMYPSNGESLVSLKEFTLCEGVLDLIYNPLLTKLLQEAKSLGIPFSNGLPMLVAQAFKAYELFTDTILDSAIIENTVSSLEQEIKNIVLIGMPGSGKTTLGKLLAKKLNRPFIDIDDLIEKQIGMSIPLFFETSGEQEFRRIECLIAEDVGKNRGHVISTGGGIILNSLNMKVLSQNGILIFLNRPLEALSLKDRPLSKSLESLYEMSSQRRPLYKKYSDYIIDISEDPYENINDILRILGGK